MKNELSLLIRTAQGNRTQNQFARECGISSAAVTRICAMQYAPKPPVLKKIADKAYGGITYELLMNAAGFTETKATTPKPSGVVLSEFESDVVGELRRLSKIDKQNLARIIFSYTQNYALVEKYKTYNSAFETAAND